LLPLEILSREIRQYNQISEKPLFQTVDRDSQYHLARTDVKIDIKQKRRQLEWLASGKKQAIFNETVIVDTKGNVN
jgi:cytochrome c biogenesis protein ResB